MAGKPELSASSVQNVVVYVSDGNFAQAYAVGQQNVAPFNSQATHNGTYANTHHQSLATVVGPPTKAFPNKPSDYPLTGVSGYFTHNPNGFQQSNVINSLAEYQNVIHNQTSFKNLVNYGGINTEVLSGGLRQAGPGRPELKLLRDDCDNFREGYCSSDSGYMSVVGGDASSQSVQCDSVRSETAESSCSSLSSTDESVVLVQPQGSEMVVYDGSVSVRPGGVVLTVGPPGSPQAQSPAPLIRTVAAPIIPSVDVPFGWKRLVNNGVIVYISPNNTALSTLDQVKEYLLTPGTCKCGLECPLKYDTVFNFDPKVFGKPLTFPPDTNTRDLTKLCNHKRKIQEMAAAACKPPDQAISKDFHSKRKKRKAGSPYSGASVSQILAQRERLSLAHPVLCKDEPPNPQYPNQVWPNTLQHPINRCYTEQPMPNPPVSSSNNVQYFRYQNQDASMNRVIMDGQHTVDSANISQHNISNYAYSPQNLQVHQQHVIGPNGQVIGFQGPINPNLMSQQQKVFINSPPIESNAPGRPNIQMVPIVPGNQPKPDRTFCNQPFQYHPGIIPQQYDPSRNLRPPYVPREPQQQQFSAVLQQQQHNIPAAPVVIQQRQNWQQRLNNPDERVPPLTQHTPPMNTWSDDSTRKKNKTNKNVKKRPFNIYDNQVVSAPCPNIDIRQIPSMNQSPQITQGSSSPSFMEDPSGYLAQQTALLNSTFSKQTGSYVCNLPCSESNEVPLPSNMPVMQVKQNFNRNNQKDMQNYNQNMARGPADSTGISVEHMHCQGCIDTQYQEGRFNNRPDSQPNSLDDPVTSSTYMEQQGSPDSRPIQGGAISTSNGSPNPTPTTPQPRMPNESHCYSRTGTSMLGVVTTMASGRTVGSNTITSVLAGRANTSTVSVNTPVTVPLSTVPTQAITVNVSRSPLEMVQSVVSSIQVPQQQSSLQIIKHSPPGHILVSSGGQLIMPPPPPKIITNQNTMPPISVSPMVTNVTAAVTQVIPAVAQQVLGQQTVLVNALPAPFVIQPGVAVTMDGLNQLPQIVTGNVIQQVDPNDGRVLRTTSMLSPDTKKKGKKRKMASQTIASMLQIAASQQNPGLVMSQPTFPQQVQMAHSPQGITAAPVMQALTIVPGKPGAPQIVMNSPGVGNPGQINLLQPVNLINGPTGMVQNFPTIQQFIVPNLVMNADGTATILQDTSNLGMQLQLQNVNGQNVLTPVQNSVFNSGQSILTAAPTGMVIRSPGSQGKIIQQQHSPGAQFLSPNGNQFVVNGAQFSGQLSPLVANVSPTQMTFSAAPLRQSGPQPHQDFIQCGQTLMVPAGNITVSSANQNTTYVQQNTTIVQQQTTMVANNAQTGVEQNFNRPLQAVLVQQTSPACRHSVSTQTAINQNTQAVTTNTFCQTSSAGSPPDTTTHSPLALEGADTTTHSGSTDDGLSPVPSDIVQQSCSMAMVHCVSSSEPDSADLNMSESDWMNIHQTDIKKCMGYSTESTSVLSGIQYVTEQMKQQDAIVSSRNNYEKINRRKYGDTLVVMENRHTNLSLFEDNDENITGQHPGFVRGDLVWGPHKGYQAWPGMLIDVVEKDVLVKWFGGDKTPTKVDPTLLQTLTEGLEAHHCARKKCRKSRKLDNQLENAIQEAMAELDKNIEDNANDDEKPNTSAGGQVTERI